MPNPMLNMKPKTKTAIPRDMHALRLLAKQFQSKQKHASIGLLPNLAARTTGRTPVEHANNYFRNKVSAPFIGPLAAQYEFQVEEPAQVKVPSRNALDLIFAIQDELDHYHLYLSNFLTHPRYGPENQVGFSRGDTLRPQGLKEVSPGVFQFRVHGLVVGRHNLFTYLRGKYLDGPQPPPTDTAKEPSGTVRIFLSMPSRPDAREVGNTEWYDFAPRTWKRHHPSIPLRPPIPILFKHAKDTTTFGPAYSHLYEDGVIRVSFIFGYDEHGHLADKDAKAIWSILTSPPKKQFTKGITGDFGYHGPGFGCSDPTGGDYRKLNFDGTSVFRRDSISGEGPIVVRYRLHKPLRVGSANTPAGSASVGGKLVPDGKTIPAGTIVDRGVSAEVRLYNFDKAAPRVSAQDLIDRFAKVFADSDVIHYDGHANYGGGFYIGEQPDDILWASDIGSYRKDFSARYQLFSIGACHGAGYFADLFYNELHPRKSPRNLDIVAAVNETAFEDAVHQGLALISSVLQIKKHGSGEPPDYLQILLSMSKPAAFQPYVGVFGRPER